jgi:DNA repair protein RadC
MCVRILLAVLMSMPVAVSANGLTPANPYAGQQTRSIKALSPEDIDELRKGAGMGLAKAAELNSIPEIAAEYWIIVHRDLRRSACVRAVIDWVKALFAEQRDIIAGVV